MTTLLELCSGLPLNPLPANRPLDPSVPHAPTRSTNLTADEIRLAIKNALRYFPPAHHRLLSGEFAAELRDFGHIYMYRFRPTADLRAHPIDSYPAKHRSAAAIMMMICNNLDPRVAQFPDELVTYGGNGQVFSNWAQFWLTMQYLANMDADQCLVLNSGHPLGLYPSSAASPRLLISNGMVVPNYSSRDHYDRLFALGVTMYGQMTAGSFCYIGPQGIVHGTTITLMNAGRKYLGLNDLSGVVFVTSGLGGMSGAQAKAATICGCIGVIAEVDESALRKRKDQRWLDEIVDDLDVLIERIRTFKMNKKSRSIGYYGNVVLLWERLADEYDRSGEVLADLGSDQTSCHNPFNGGYYPVQLSVDESRAMMTSDPIGFRRLCEESLCRQVLAVNRLADAGLRFWDYGNAFLLEAHRAGADVRMDSSAVGVRFRYPSYVQDIMGDVFSLGFGPFRWVCGSGEWEDLRTTDRIAAEVLERLASGQGISAEVRDNYRDNIKWIREADKHGLVVGSLARILYSDLSGRAEIALAFNEAVRRKELLREIVISRDHHDVSGADSPYRETSNVTDGSAFTADMSVCTALGNACRGATWVAIHNGGGVGFGEAINCGFGLVLDGSRDAADRAVSVLSWDVANGVSRRSWSGNGLARETVRRVMAGSEKFVVTIPSEVDDRVLEDY